MRTLIMSLFIMVTYGCNVFDCIEPNTNHFDRCKMEADKGNWDKAIEECNKADPNGIDTEVQIELGDIYLASIGINIFNLSEVFFNSDEGTEVIVDLAESILDDGDVTDEDKTHADSAITAFDRADSDFYSTLSRLCYIAVIMAYTDNDGRGSVAAEGDGSITKGDICNAATCNNPICINAVTDCDGMSQADATRVGQIMVEIGDFLADLGATLFIGDDADLDDALIDMGDMQVPDPANPSQLKTISELTSSTVADGTRELLYDMVEAD